MCGINGAFAFHYAANPIDRGELVAVRDHMTARGPDGAGIWMSANDRVGFGHRRLAIIDLSPSGHQPMSSADGRYIVTFNGEIYNFDTLRCSLEVRGYVFRSRSDTEVLLHLFAEKGAAMVHDLRGMFAFAIWDNFENSLFLARDPYGIKPLYYADDGWTFRFASQVKALVAGGGISSDPEPAGIVGFHLFGSVPEPFTTHAAIRALPAGCTMTVARLGAAEPVRYHSIAASYVEAEASNAPQSSAVTTVQSALRKSVRDHLVSDVAVGAFLSAGVDSGALVGLMRDAGATDIKTVTIAFEEFRGRHEDEAKLAADVARYYGTDHTTRVVTQAEFTTDLPRILDAMDQPSIDGVNTWFVAKAARERGLKVAISGLGGDELLGGYPSFRNVQKLVRWLCVPGKLPLFGKLLRLATVPIARKAGINPKLPGLLEYGGTDAGAYLLQRGLFLPWELQGCLDADLIAKGLERLAPMALLAKEIEPRPKSAFARVAALESSLYMRNQLLRDADWASMAHSLEVRVPLVDSVLLEATAPFAGRFGGQTGKQLLGRAPSKPLPENIVVRAKTGFTTPIENWQKAMNDGGQPKQHLTSQKTPWARQWSAKIARQQIGGSAA
jgi:asparagine synthase (glutamine-hydrolysing)